MEEETIETEQASFTGLVAFNKVAWIIIKRRWFLLTVVFCTIAALLAKYLADKAATSVSRYESSTVLMFTPKKITKIENLTDKQLMSILERPSLKREVLAQVPMDAEEQMCLGKDINIEKDRRQNNVFMLTAASKTRQGAIDKANVYANLLVEEYVTFRTTDFSDWKKSLVTRRETISQEISRLDTLESELMARTGVLSPKEALLVLNTLISDQRRNLSALGVDTATEELKKKKLESEIGGQGPTVMANARAIRRRVDAITAVDADLASLREKFTDVNPKVSGKVKERANLVAELEAFLKEKGAEGLDIEKMDQLEKTAGALADCATRMEAINEKKLTLEQEISDNEKQAAKLIADVVEQEKIETRRTDLKSSLRNLDEQIDNITYALGSLRNDLRQIEPAKNATDNGKFGIKQAVLAVGGGGACVAVLAMILLATGLIFGTVRGGKEVSVYKDINFLGSLPKRNSLPEEEERNTMVVVAQKALDAGRDAKTVLLCRLPGCEANQKFSEVMEFTASMSGTRCFTIDIVQQQEFTPPEGSEEMIGIVRNGQHGWFPVLNRYAVAPTELQMLNADIATLCESFDTVFIRLKENGVRVGGTFFDQILGLCGAVLLGVGDHTTTRRTFAYARRHMKASGKPVMAIVTNTKAKIVREEMEVMK